MIDHVFFERRLMAAESFAGELRDAGVRADIGPVDGYPGLVVTQSDGTRLLFTISELGATPAAVLAEVDTRGRARRRGGIRRFSAQLAFAAVAAGVMLLTAAIGGTQ